MTSKIFPVILILLAPAVSAFAQTPPPPPPGQILSNPEAPRPAPPANPSGVPPLPTFVPSTILTPGSGR